MTRKPITFTRAVPEDAAELAADLRDADAREMMLHMGFGPRDGVALSCYASDACFAGRVGGRLFCLFGVCRDSVLSDTATIWALGTRAIDASPRDFLRGSVEGMRIAMSALPDVDAFSNWVLVENEASARWLDWLGAHWGHGTLVTPFGGRFRQFTLGR